MVVINCAYMHKDIIQTVETLEMPKCKLVEEKPMSLIFETDMDDSATAASLIKKAIKADPKFAALYFVINAQ